MRQREFITLLSGNWPFAQRNDLTIYRAPLRRVIKRPTLRSVGYYIDQRYPSFRLQWNLPYTEGMISPSSSSARVAKASIF